MQYVRWTLGGVWTFQRCFAEKNKCHMGHMHMYVYVPMESIEHILNSSGLTQDDNYFQC